MPQAGNYNPSGEIVLSSRYTVFIGDAVAKQQFPICVVYIRQTSAHRREFDRICERLGIALDPQDEHGTAFVAIGSPEALERLTGHPSVKQWHHAIKRDGPGRGQGAMPKK